MLQKLTLFSLSLLHEVGAQYKCGNIGEAFMLNLLGSTRLDLTGRIVLCIEIIYASERNTERWEKGTLAPLACRGGHGGGQ
jgi:hypothetical protein